jgi:CheY-like chemotaxis protein
MPPTSLVVDDDPDLRHVLAALLANAGQAIAPASDGLMVLRQNMPDRILSDVLYASGVPSKRVHADQLERHLEQHGPGEATSV